MKSIKMVESRKNEVCGRCDQTIDAKTFHIIVNGKIRFHMECWEKKKKEFKQKFGIL